MAARLAGTPWRVNAEVPGHVTATALAAALGRSSREAERLLDRGVLTARGVDRVVRVAWTLADLAGRGQPDAGDVRVAALRLRGGWPGGRPDPARTRSARAERAARRPH